MNTYFRVKVRRDSAWRRFRLLRGASETVVARKWFLAWSKLLDKIERAATHPDRIVKRCSCGIAFSAKEWRALRSCGVQSIPAGGGEPAERLELRDCPRCGSTMALPVEVYNEKLGGWFLTGPLADAMAFESVRHSGGLPATLPGVGSAASPDSRKVASC